MSEDREPYTAPADAEPVPTPEAAPAAGEWQVMTCADCGNPWQARIQYYRHSGTGAEEQRTVSTCQTFGCPANPFTRTVALVLVMPPAAKTGRQRRGR